MSDPPTKKPGVHVARMPTLKGPGASGAVATTQTGDAPAKTRPKGTLRGVGDRAAEGPHGGADLDSCVGDTDEIVDRTLTPSEERRIQTAIEQLGPMNEMFPPKKVRAAYREDPKLFEMMEYAGTLEAEERAEGVAARAEPVQLLGPDSRGNVASDENNKAAAKVSAKIPSHPEVKTREIDRVQVRAQVERNAAREDQDVALPDSDSEDVIIEPVVKLPTGRRDMPTEVHSKRMIEAAKAAAAGPASANTPASDDTPTPADTPLAKSISPARQRRGNAERSATAGDVESSIQPVARTSGERRRPARVRLASVVALFTLGLGGLAFALTGDGCGEERPRTVNTTLAASPSTPSTPPLSPSPSVTSAEPSPAAPTSPASAEPSSSTSAVISWPSPPPLPTPRPPRPDTGPSPAPSPTAVPSASHTDTIFPPDPPDTP